MATLRSLTVRRRAGWTVPAAIALLILIALPLVSLAGGDDRDDLATSEVTLEDTTADRERERTTIPHTEVGDDLVRVELTATGSIAEARDWLQAHQFDIEVESRDRFQVLTTVEHAETLTHADHLLHPERPGLWVPLQTSPSATGLIGADRWRDAGFSGHDVDIAVLDSGFSGFQAALGATLPRPSQVRAHSFRADGSLEVTDHGRRAAEIVHRVAPGAMLHLVNFDTITELSAAVDHLIEENVTAVSFSLGYIHNGRGDGTGPVNEIVSRATQAGIAWVAASGNWAQQHWSGTFQDTTGNSLHEFAPGATENAHMFQSGDLITVSLRWDDPWGAACSDYDIELFGPDGSLVRAARTIQNCNSDPVESLRVLATETGTYRVRIIQAHAEVPRELDLMVVGTPDRGHSLQFQTPQGSLSEPADHPQVITVGALASGGAPAEAPYSSRGPTRDGRAKPDVLAPTGITSSGAGFSGTSASAPHATGVIALFAEAFPEADRGVFQTLVQARAVPVQATEEGTPGIRRLDTGTLLGTGTLLPAGATEATLLGNHSEEGGLALLVYRGPNDYPLRFAHLLLDGQSVPAVFRFSTVQQTWSAYITGAPAWANSFGSLNDGDAVVFRLDPL